MIRKIHWWTGIYGNSLYPSIHACKIFIRQLVRSIYSRYISIVLYSILQIGISRIECLNGKYLLYWRMSLCLRVYIGTSSIYCIIIYWCMINPAHNYIATYDMLLRRNMLLHRCHLHKASGVMAFLISCLAFFAAYLEDQRCSPWKSVHFVIMSIILHLYGNIWWLLM